MPIRVDIDFYRGLRFTEFTGAVQPDELDLFGALYFDTRYYRFEHLELAVFAPDCTLAAVSALDLGELADVYAAALRERSDVVPSRSAWVVHDGIINEARMWRQFVRAEPADARERNYVADLPAALAVLDLPTEWAADVASRTGFTRFRGAEATRGSQSGRRGP